MVAGASGEQLAAETRLVVDLEHVDAGMRDVGLNERCNGLLPGRERLAREARDQVDVQVRNPRGAQALQVLEHYSPAVESAALLGFAVDEGLNTEADASDARLGKRCKGRVGNLARGALDGDLGIRFHREFPVNGSEEFGNQIRFEQARCSAAEIDGVDAGR